MHKTNRFTLKSLNFSVFLAAPNSKKLRFLLPIFLE